MAEALALLSSGPAKARDIEGHGRPITAGEPANLLLFDPGVIWSVVGDELRTRSRNTAFEGHEVRGRAVHTVLRGKFTLNDGKVV